MIFVLNFCGNRNFLTKILVLHLAADENVLFNVFLMTLKTDTELLRTRRRHYFISKFQVLIHSETL